MNIDNIRKIELEITSDCNAACPGCARTQNIDLFDVESFSSITEGLDFVCLHWTTLHKDIIQHCKNNNILVFSYTVKDDFILNHMRNFKVDGIISNYFFE